MSGIVRLIKTPEIIEVSIGNRKVKCKAAISEVEEEVVLNDKMCDSLVSS